MKLIQKVGRFYSHIIMKNIGIFIFIGLLFVVFGEHGWFPHKDIYAISQLMYGYILPSMIACEGGRAVGGERAGILACLAVAGIVVAASSVGLMAALIMGPASGLIWKNWEKLMEKKIPGSLQMLVRNLTVAVGGCVLAVAGYLLVLPVFEAGTALIYRGVNFMIVHRMESLLSFVIEPGKVFFMNNVLNHAVLTPLGLEQVQETGSSVLFLLETNPGPGLGLLAALYYRQKDRRDDYSVSIFTQLIGGLHEVYFPLVLADIRLLAALIAGGFAGDFCFGMLNAGVGGVVSPGSLIVLLLMAGRYSMLPVLAGVIVSALVTFTVSAAILRIEKTDNSTRMEEEKLAVPVQKKIEKIVFVCDGGVGSSAMGAAIFRRMLARQGITGITVEAFAVDLVPDEADILVCQKDFSRMLPETIKNREIYTVENLVSSEGYGGLLDQIQKRVG